MAKAKKQVKKKPAAKAAPKKPAKPVAKKAAKPVKKAAKPVAKKPVKKAPAKAKPVAKKPVKKVAAKPAKKAAPVKKAAKKVVANKPAKKAAPKKAVKKAPVKPVKKAIAKKPAATPAKKAAKPVVKAKPQPKVQAKPAKPVVAKAPVKPAAPSKKELNKKEKISKKNKKGADHDGIPLEDIKILEEDHKPKKAEKISKKKEPKIIKEMPARALITMEKKEEPKEQLHYEYPTLRYSDEELREFKDIIDKKLVTSRDELKNLKESLDSHTDSQAGNKSWNMEEGQDTSEMEYLMNQISRQNKFIRDLEMALVRIENKTYGICRATGKLIDKNRLRIVPHATLSIEAKMNRKSDDIPTPGSGNAPAHMGSEGEGFGSDD
ncbi:MAG: hypothetical protein U0T73_13920 [Chitinophagales bacterium]